ncbi:Hypothetical protein FKW44_006366 [Caligus rogercresseyi]|uniref:Uncharacterized protein n=1 Tax=Caligus rogercresseyi TaxID=217165 RepID=A0A7T8KDB6_CALRO|nr:Hypothetical protein FKW44_006366 [Caligus rogercresseyi]
MVNFYSMCPPPASTTVSTRDLNALTDLDTSAASKDMATDVMELKGLHRVVVGSHRPPPPTSPTGSSHKG